MKRFFDLGEPTSVERMRPRMSPTPFSSYEPISARPAAVSSSAFSSAPSSAAGAAALQAARLAVRAAKAKNLKVFDM